MNPMTHPQPDSVESVQPFGISPAPRTGVVRFIGFLTAAVGIISLIALPFGYVTLSTGAFLGPDDSHARAVMMGAMITFEIFVAVLATASGIAAVAGKIWSRSGIMLYAVISILVALLGIVLMFKYIPSSADSDNGMRHTIQTMVVIKQWIVELPLSLAILYTFTRPTIKRAYADPQIQSPDRSQR